MNTLAAVWLSFAFLFEMDIAYDHITEETFSSDRAPTPTPRKAEASSPSRPNLNAEFQETFRAFSNSPWGAKLGGLWGNVRRQGEQYYEEARREVGEASEEALRGISGLKETIVKQTQSLSLEEEKKGKEGSVSADAGADDTIATDTGSEGRQSSKKRTESEVIRENDSLIAKFRSEATKRLKDMEKAEDAADEALLRFGTNIRNFLRDTVAIAPPTDDTGASIKDGSVLFESKDSAGKRVIHTTRFDAQLHVIHSTSSSFTKDPISDEWPKFKEDFKTDQKTEDISNDLRRYPDLRIAMEQLVPEEVDYRDFWCRYYFLRLVIETEEQKRKELLKGMLHYTIFPRRTCKLIWPGRSQVHQPNKKTTKKLSGTPTQTKKNKNSPPPVPQPHTRSLSHQMPTPLPQPPSLQSHS